MATHPVGKYIMQVRGTPMQYHSSYYAPKQPWLYAVPINKQVYKLGKALLGLLLNFQLPIIEELKF